MSCFQGFPTEISRDKQFEYCENNKTVRIEMPKEGSLVKFHNGLYQFKVPFVMYADFEAILEPIHAINPNPEISHTKEINKHIHSGFCVYSKFAYGKVKDPLKLYKGEDCVQVFCDYIYKEARRLCYVFPEKPIKPPTHEQWRKFN